MTGTLGKERAADAICLNFRKALHAVCHSVLIVRLVQYGLDKRAISWVENWLCHQAEGGVTSSAKSSRQPGTGIAPQTSLGTSTASCFP